jgi:hypothetical protein
MIILARPSRAGAHRVSQAGTYLNRVSPLAWVLSDPPGGPVPIEPVPIDPGPIVPEPGDPAPIVPDPIIPSPTDPLGDPSPIDPTGLGIPRALTHAALPLRHRPRLCEGRQGSLMVRHGAP